MPVWDTLSPTMKDTVKTANFGMLIDPNRVVRRAAAAIVSAICYIELPRKEWEGIVPTMCENINHKD
jgi:hypothetical protein